MNNRTESLLGEPPTDREQREFLERLEAAARDGTGGTPELVKQLQDQTNPEEFLIEVALRRVANASEQSVIAPHLADPRGVAGLVLSAQEYSAIFSSARLIDRDIHSARQECGWAREHLDALQSGRPVTRPALRLIHDLRSIAQEAAHLVLQAAEMLRRRAQSAHGPQMQAVARAERVYGSLHGLRIVAINELSDSLHGQLLEAGAEVEDALIEVALESDRFAPGDLLSAQFNGPFDIAVAASADQQRRSTGAKRTTELDARRRLLAIRGLLKNGGIAVIETSGQPLPFSEAQARACGFNIELQLIPQWNLSSGGRGCCLRRIPDDSARNELTGGRKRRLPNSSPPGGWA